MVQGYYSLDEAAGILSMPVEELIRMIQKREVRAFADKGSWKFRQQDIEELRRTRQLGSDPEIPLMEKFRQSVEPMESDEHVILDAGGMAPPGAGPEDVTLVGMRDREKGSDSDVRLVLTSDEGSGSDSDIRIAAPTTGGSGSQDSIHFEPGQERLPSDSDVRLSFDSSAIRKKTLPGEPTDEISIDKATISAGSGDEFNFDDDLSAGFKIEGEDELNLDDLESATADLPAAPKPSKPGKPASKKDSDLSIDLSDEGTPDSDFNLSDSDFTLAADAQLKADSADSDFVIDPGASESDDFDVNLDSSDDSADIFGVEGMPALKDESKEKMAPAKPAAKPAAKAASKTESASDSAELEFSDFEVEEESGSEVIALEEDEAEESDEEEEEFDLTEDEEDQPGRTAKVKAAAKRAALASATPAVVSAPWPGWILPFLSLTTISMALVGMMMHEVMRNAWSFNAPYSLSGTIINQVYELGKMVGLAS